MFKVVRIVISIIKLPFIIIWALLLLITALFLEGCILLSKLCKWVIKKAEANLS